METKKYPLSSVEMSQSEANWLFENGSIVVILDMPAGFEFGIDYNSWTVGEKFKGVKMIPPGFHIVHFNSLSKSNEISPRTSFLHFFKPKEIFVKKWDKDLEEMKDCQIDIDQIEESKKEFDRYLGVYPYENYKKWVSLTDHVTEKAVERIVPSNGRLFSVTQFHSEVSNSQQRLKRQEDKEKYVNACEKKDENGFVELERLSGSELRFMKIPDLEEQGKLTSSQVSQMSMDHSYKLQILISSNGSSVILAELQLVYLCFLVGQVYDAFEQWKKLVNMFCSCEEAMSNHPELFGDFISVLHFQIKEISEDFFTDIVTKDNFLYSCLSKFFDNVHESICHISLKNKATKFKTHLEKKFKYSFELDLDEYAPVIVEET